MAKQFKLPDGRNLDYAVYGPPDGFPFVWIHGTPGAYTPVPELLRTTDKNGLKLIVATRAGYGNSTRYKERRIVDAVADLAALNEHLGVKQCLVGGMSGGGPHALACAARLPGCVAALSVAAVAPYDAEGLDFLAGQGQDNIDETNAALAGREVLQERCEKERLGMVNMDDAAGIIEGMSSVLPKVDRRAITQSAGVGQYMIEIFKESLKHNADGWVDDTMAFITPWGFELSEIKIPVVLYQGSEDKFVPFAHGKWLAAHIPQEKLTTHFADGEGHISIFFGKTETLIEDLMQAGGLKEN